MWNYANVRTPLQPTLMTGRVLVWFSCGAASAMAAKLAVEKYSAENVEVLYCNTLKYEHPDNLRFLRDVERWIGQPVKILDPLEYTGYADIFDVFDKTGWLVGPGGARCSTELKKRVRFLYQNPEDLHVFGLTADEPRRLERFQEDNFGLYLDWVLRDQGVTHHDCLLALKQAGIALPVLYQMGYRNNNCIGCVKGGMGYWNKIRRDFPEAFQRMVKQERKMGVSVINGVYLDELEPDRGRYEAEPDIECGPQCLIDHSEGG
jgi:hypothetical protein